MLTYPTALDDPFAAVHLCSPFGCNACDPIPEGAPLVPDTRQAIMEAALRAIAEMKNEQPILVQRPWGVMAAGTQPSASVMRAIATKALEDCARVEAALDRQCEAAR